MINVEMSEFYNHTEDNFSVNTRYDLKETFLD